MMGERTVMQETLFYEFSLERHVPSDHLLRAIGRPSIDPDLMIRMLIIGYCFAIRSERRLCEEVHLNLAYRWFCRLGLEGDVPDHSTFSKNRHGRFRDSDLLRKNVEREAFERCVAHATLRPNDFTMEDIVEGGTVQTHLIMATYAPTRTARTYRSALPSSWSGQFRQDLNDGLFY